MKDNVTKGSTIGLILIITSILTLRLNNDIENTIKMFKYFAPILIGYILIGVFIQLVRNFPPKKNTGGTRGIGLFYFLFIIITSSTILANFVPSYIRYIILSNIIVLFALWFIDYISLSQVAKELNGVSSSYRNRTLVIDLDHKPKNRDEFFTEIEKYCKSNKISFEYVEKDLPAIINMNGTLNKIELTSYYGFTGILVYTLKITEL